MTASAVLMAEDEAGSVLIVKPTYRSDNKWLLVGGIIEENESPLKACKREIKEELGLELNLAQLLYIEYCSSYENVPESIHFIFFDLLSKQQRDAIRLPHTEIEKYRVCNQKDAYELLAPRISKRLGLALGALCDQKIVFVIDGLVVSNKPEATIQRRKDEY